ncbi:MAG TPA: hypothetical protein VGN75_01025 [Kaistia sp.]|nr:hypothetical protein [Kaistia sp.]
MKLIAIDTIHISSVKAENLLPGEEFETDEGTAKLLLQRGLVHEVKAKAAPKNKAEAPPADKTDGTDDAPQAAPAIISAPRARGTKAS